MLLLGPRKQGLTETLKRNRDLLVVLSGILKDQGPWSVAQMG
jgi:hypothetical protein